MTSDNVDKHRANIIQIAGYGFMTPFGNLIINLFSLDPFKYGLAFLCIYTLAALFLFYFGIICIVRSWEIVKGINK